MTIESGTPPGSQPAPPPEYARQSNQADWILQSLNQVSSQLGRLDESVQTLKTDIADTKKVVTRIQMILAMATGAIIIIGYFIDKKFDTIMATIQ